LTAVIFSLLSFENFSIQILSIGRAFFHFLGGRSSAANRKQDYKYIHFFDDGSDELYNLKQDESETTNLVETHQQERNEHRILLKNWISEVKGAVPEGQHNI